MISDAAVELLSKLTYRLDAGRRYWAIPFAGIYWEDELPEFRELVTLPQTEQIDIFRVLGIRVKIWNNELLSEDEQRLWNDSQSRIPEWPLFRRLDPSPEDRQAQAETEDEVAEGLTQLFGDADKVMVDTDESGVEQWSATFDLTKRPVESDRRRPGGDAF